MIARSMVIQKSIDCFRSGVMSFVPGLGVVFAGMALARFKAAVMGANDRWNPARGRLYAGVMLALFSLLAHGLVGLVLFLKVIRGFYYG
jgi:hypothetical protein